MSCLNHLFLYSSWVNDESDRAVVYSGGITTHNTQYMSVCVYSTLKMMGSRSMNNLDGETTQADPREEDRNYEQLQKINHKFNRNSKY